MEKLKITKWESDGLSGAKRCNIHISDWLPDWFVGTGKDESCYLEGTWWDMICLAKNILANPNTRQCCPEYYHPEWKNDNYCGENRPYEFIEENQMKEICGNCKHNKRDFSKPQNKGYAEFCCGNEDGENYGVPTMYDDSCDDFEEKE